jgi:YD repeat-containing protein
MTRIATAGIPKTRSVAAALLLVVSSVFAQTPPPSDMVRVTVSMNTDGSRTTYEWDTANHKATATTMDGNNVREKIRYVLDDNGRFVTGEVFGPKDKLRFVTRYKYDTSGRVSEETQLSPEGAVQHRIVHSYNTAGKETGYMIYDANGRIEHREGATR